MPKQPDLKTIDDGWYETSDINYNFSTIAAAFENALWRTAEDGEAYPTTPNQMDVDLDVADANVTNVNQLDISSIEVGNVAFAGFDTQYLYRLGILSCGTGDMITHDIDGNPICLEAGADGQVLTTTDDFPAWGEDTDTDTIGVTIQEDGVTVAENVTNINWVWTDATFPTLVTTPASNQVDLALDDVLASTLVAIWEDTRSTNDLNVRPDGPDGQYMDDDAFRTRVDLVTTVGITVPTSDNEYYVIVETSNNTTDSVGAPAAQGTWTNGVEFFDATGTATVNTGNLLNAPAGEVGSRAGSTDGGNLLTTYCGIPAGTRYIDFAHADLFLFPVFATGGTVDNRYRAVLSAAVQTNGFLSPNNIAYPGGTNTSVTP